MNTNNAVFNFSIYNLNDTFTAEEIIFNSSEDKFVWIELPKNSTILNSLIEIEGISKPVQASTQQEILDLKADNIIPENEWDEIIIGSTASNQNLKVFNASGYQLWNYSISVDITAVSSGNFSLNPGKEIIASSSEPKIYILNSTGSLLQTKTMLNYINDIETDDILSLNPFDEIVLASNDNNIYLLSYNLSELWSFTASQPFQGVGVGDLSSDSGKEIAASSGTTIYIFNSTGKVKNTKDIGVLIKDVDVGNTDNSGYDEIAVTTSNNTVYLFDSSLNFLWSYPSENFYNAYKIKIAEVTTEYTGKEIVFGSGDDYIYVLSKDGVLIWKYKTENDVKSISIGNLTTDPGNEVVAGTKIPATKTLYILNFEYFPTNPYLNIGNDSDTEWSYSGKFRTKQNITSNSEIQQFINNCQPNENGFCYLPLLFHSDFQGILKINYINITYMYNITNLIQVNTVMTWSRTKNIWANESVGNQIINISYINPSHDISFRYVKVNDAATSCDFNGTKYIVINMSGNKVCDLTKNRIIPSSGNTSFDWIWDNTMTSSTPVYYNETQGISEYGFWKKNITVWNSTQQIFMNITLNTTLDENYITGNSKIKVDWFNNGTLYDITPSSRQTNCKNNPTYTEIKVGNYSFYVCKQDTNDDGRIDFFVWKQPDTNKSHTVYEISGSANNPAKIDNISFTPSQDFWDKNFTVTFNVSDSEGNNISVRVCLNLTKTFDLNQVNVSTVQWECFAEKNTTGSTISGEQMKFKIQSNMSWTGYNLLLIQLKDFDEIVEYHEWANSGIYFWPNVTKHQNSIAASTGNGASVNRGESILLSTQINDTVSNTPATNVRCRFWVSINNTDWDEGKDVLSNSSGFCNYNFSPNSTYKPGERWWKAAIFNDSYYVDNTTQNYTISIYGKININISQDTLQKNITRNYVNYLKGVISDEYGIPINISGYQCQFKLNTTLLGNNNTNSNGVCLIKFQPDCSYNLGKYTLNITLSGNPNPYYVYDQSLVSNEIYLKEKLNANILSPLGSDIYHKNEYMNLSFEIQDSCGIPQTYNTTWLFNCTTNTDVYQPFFNSTSEQNTTWQVQCNPGILELFLESEGPLYEKNVSKRNIDIYGWSKVKMIHPINGTYNRTETNRSIDIVCSVSDENPSIKLDGYKVDILYIYEGSSPVKLASMNTIYSSQNDLNGRINYTWNISSNQTVPEGMYKIICNISDQVLEPYRKYNASVKQDYADVLILERDTTPPKIIKIVVNSTKLSENTTLYANITDWYGVDSVWLKLFYPDGSNQTFYLTNTTPDKRQTLWTVTFTNMNIIGDYDIVLHANDTSNFTSTNQSWFEVYLPIQLYSETSYPKKFTLYRPGTTTIIHNFTYSPGWHNLTLHQRNYDFKAEITDDINQNHEIIFKDLNTTLTSENQFGQVSNITNPLNITTIPLSLLNPPVPWRHEVAGVYISTNFVYSNLTVSFDYSKKLNEIDYAPALVIYKCSNWTGQCNSGWVELNTTVNTTSYKVFTIQNSTSAYYAFEAEMCGNGIYWNR